MIFPRDRRTADVENAKGIIDVEAVRMFVLENDARGRRRIVNIVLADDVLDQMFDVTSDQQTFFVEDGVLFQTGHVSRSSSFYLCF